MTIETEIYRNDYTGNGSTATYDYDFKILTEADLYVVETLISTGVETVLAYPADYTVTGAGNADGGSITLTAGNLPSTKRLTIKTRIAVTQPYDFRNAGDFDPAQHEDAMDRLHMVNRQQQEQLDRGIKLPEGVDPDDFSTTLPPITLGGYLKVNSAGDGLEFVVSEVPDAAVSAFMATVLVAANATDARTLLATLSSAAGAVGTTNLADDAVTYAKLQNVSATQRILGRKTALAGNAEEMTLSEVLDFIGSAAHGDILFRGASAWQKLAAGTAGRFLKTMGAGFDPEWGAAGLTISGPHATTSGTAVGITGIPSGTKFFVLALAGVSTDSGASTAVHLMQLGDSGGYETSGYDTGMCIVNGGYPGAVGVETRTDGIGFQTAATGASATNTAQGLVFGFLQDSSTNTWSIISVVGVGGSGNIFISQTKKSLSAELDRLRLTTTGGTANYDAGAMTLGTMG